MDDEALKLAAALDARHAEARSAFADRDARAYSDLFSDRLRYERSNGKVIGKSELMRDVKAQFRRMSGAESRFVRAKLALDGGNLTETLRQQAVYEASAFGFVRRTWSIERRCRYTWTMENGYWRVIDVLVNEERVRSNWRLSF